MGRFVYLVERLCTCFFYLFIKKYRQETDSTTTDPMCKHIRKYNVTMGMENKSKK